MKLHDCVATVGRVTCPLWYQLWSTSCAYLRYNRIQHALFGPFANGVQGRVTCAGHSVTHVIRCTGSELHRNTANCGKLVVVELRSLLHNVLQVSHPMSIRLNYQTYWAAELECLVEENAVHLCYRVPAHQRHVVMAALNVVIDETAIRLE